MNRSELKRMIENPATNALSRESLRQELARRSSGKKRSAGEYKSAWESEFAAILESRRQSGAIAAWGYERIRLRIGKSSDRKGAKAPIFTPDFHVVLPDGRVRFFEVKGFARESYKVRSGAAADLFPYFTFVVVAKKAGAWQVIETFNGGSDDRDDCGII
jgi:hypothetical protein